MPSSPPPPPLPEENFPGKEETKKKKSKSKDKVDSVLETNRSASGLGGRLMNGGSQPRAVDSHSRLRGHPFPHTQPMMMIPMNMKKAGTFSARQKSFPLPIPPYMMYGGGPPQPFGIHYGPPPPLMKPPGPFGPGAIMGRPGSRAMEEPPLGGGHFTPDGYFNQQQPFATVDKSNRFRKGKPISKDTKGKHIQSSDSNSEDSEFNHNKEEHPVPFSMQKSRSQGSLSHMKFLRNSDTQPNGESNENGERDFGLFQMMTELELGDEHIERRMVPPGLYPAGQLPNMMYGAPLLPPHQHAHMVRVPTDPVHRRKK